MASRVNVQLELHHYLGACEGACGLGMPRDLVLVAKYHRKMGKYWMASLIYNKCRCKPHDLKPDCSAVGGDNLSFTCINFLPKILLVIIWESP